MNPQTSSRRLQDGGQTRSRALPSRSGYTLIEFLVVLLILAIVLATGVPSLLQQIHKSRMTGYAREISLVLQKARYEGIRQHVTIIARLDQSQRSVIAFADINGESLGDPPDGIFNPIDGETYRDTDYEVGRAILPGQVKFSAPAGYEIIEGFTTINGEQAVQFSFDGSVTDPGALRFADDFENYLDVTISPAATGRVRIRKYDTDLDRWLEDGEEGLRWHWYN